MFKRLMLIGALVISLVAMSSTHANAQFFDGWGWFGFSSVRGEIHTTGTPNPLEQPSQIIVMVSADVQIACLNPAGKGVFNGKAFHRTIAGVGIAGNEKITTQGDTITTVFLALNQFEVVENCPNRNWTPVTDSAMALNFTGTVTWCLLDETGAPDCKNGRLDQSTVTCELDPTNPKNQREPKTGKAPEGAIFSCSEPQ